MVAVESGGEKCLISSWWLTSSVPGGPGALVDAWVESSQNDMLLVHFSKLYISRHIRVMLPFLHSWPFCRYYVGLILSVFFSVKWCLKTVIRAFMISSLDN